MPGGSGALAALGVTGLVLPAVGIGVVVALPLAAWPYVQWGVTIAAALAAYSLAVRAVEAAVEPARVSGRALGERGASPRRARPAR